MTHRPRVTDLVVTDAPRADQALGLLAFIRFTIDHQLVLDGVALRRGRDGRLLLSWPERRDRAGRRHSIVRPVGDDERVALEQAVFAAMNLPAEAIP